MATTPSVGVVARENIPAITTVVVNGVSHSLGRQQDFRRDPFLNSFLPLGDAAIARTSIAWVRLRDGETLEVHEHPVKSMVIVCKGSALLTGDHQQQLNEGDVVWVEPFSKHGFISRPGEEFYGISIQFEGKGLYEDLNNARVKFSSSSLADLHQFNDQQLEVHTKNSFFKLVESGRLEKDPKLFQRFVTALYVWSRCFQRVLLTRQIMCVDKELLEEYTHHLNEELGHDALLRDCYNISEDAYDPILEAASNWFVTQMYLLDEAEKIVVVHLVIESSGHAFGVASSKYFKDRETPKGTENYFKLHAQADDDHRDIGEWYLKRQSAARMEGLKDTCKKAWDQMNLVTERIAAWALAGDRV